MLDFAAQKAILDAGEDTEDTYRLDDGQLTIRGSYPHILDVLNKLHNRAACVTATDDPLYLESKRLIGEIGKALDEF